MTYPFECQYPLHGRASGGECGSLTSPLSSQISRPRLSSHTGLPERCVLAFEPGATQRRLSRKLPRGPLQPPGLWAITKTTYARHGIPGFYSGVGALVAGNSLKAGVRFLSYDSFKQMLVDKDVRWSLSPSSFRRKIWGSPRQSRRAN